ncbi:FAD-dependent oxidoreductase [Mycobacterium sp. 3519A]|uniref:FAD-dependent oxidoreductase n=1 Tax=Mycobacterium sp. 3519A TaxID=2057184 RepID=UPI000C7E1FE7|nr:FAD-dependent oxidoreductase [Mycobacterium sp. 3519A]
MSEHITTPASCERRPTVAVLGAGIAGLTAAHELAERGFVVTVYEARRDERNGLGSAPAGTYPPVKLGGLAASQYSTMGTRDGSRAELRPFPGRRGQPRPPSRAVAGEHGFRFFPAYYLHIWDLFNRIPVYEPMETADGTTEWIPTSRTIMDNVRRVVTQGTTVEGKPSLVFPRELPRSPAEFLSILSQLAGLGFTASDVATFQSRLLRYLVTSPLRRARELQNMSSYDFFVGRDSRTGINRYSYTQNFDSLLREMPRVLAAFDPRWGDARTNITTYLQLYLNMGRRDDKADGVLNGPTTEAWFDHWYRHLTALGVRFVHAAATCLDPPVFDPGRPAHLRPRTQITLADGTQINPDYAVVALDAPAAEYLTSALRAAGTGGTVARLDGFATSPPPPDGPFQPQETRSTSRRDPYAMDQLGRVPWDRFQTLCGIQYYFDTEFQLLRGHMYYAGTEWGLSSINQHGMWERRPILDRDGHVSVLSVDIGDFNTPSRHLVDEFGRGKAARDCTPDEIAAEVWRQIVAALTSNAESAPQEVMPWPVWYALDRGLVMEIGPGQGQGRIVRNETPYLVPIVGDWVNRPSSDPWNPHGTSWSSAPSEAGWLKDLEQRNVWQARHGGYQVHNNSVVFAGTWNKTFTRMTSMEAACESGRHAVNAILDHYIWVESGGVDRRERTTLRWEFPYGFLDQGLSSPIRLPTPAGDYCYVFDIENREPADTRALRTLDSKFTQQSLPHPLDTPALPSSVPLLAGGQQMFTPPIDYNQQLLGFLQTWQRLLEQWMTMTPGMPTAPPVMPTMPPASPMPPAPADYTQQLFGYLQAWRQYLEQMTGARPGLGQPPTGQPPYYYDTGSTGQSSQHRPIPPDRDDGSRRNFQAVTHQGSSPTPPPEPDVVALAPQSHGGSQGPADLSLFNRKPREREVWTAPTYDFGNQIERLRRGPETSMRQEAAAVRESAAKPSAQSVPKSLYSISAARTVPRAAGRQGSK